MQDPVYVCKERLWTSPHRIRGIFVMLWSKFLVRRADTVDWGGGGGGGLLTFVTIWLRMWKVAFNATSHICSRIDYMICLNEIIKHGGEDRK